MKHDSRTIPGWLEVLSRLNREAMDLGRTKNDTIKHIALRRV